MTSSSDGFVPGLVIRSRQLTKPTPVLGKRSPKFQDALAAAAEHSQDAVLLAEAGDSALRLVYVNRAFEVITGYTHDEAIGQNCRYLQGGDRSQPEIAMIRDAIREMKPVAVTLRNYRKDGTLFWNALKLQPIFDADGVATHILALARDVSKFHHIADQLDQAQHLDKLTNVLNRYAIVERLDAILATHTALPLVVKVDIGGFHVINTSYGFDIGDLLLRGIAERLTGMGCNLVGRTGSDEFSVACLVSNREEAQGWLDRISAALQEPYRLPGAAIEVVFATGFVIGEPGADALTLMRQAATALRRSESDLLSGACEFNLEDDARARKRLQLTRELKNALPLNELRLHYQPKVDLGTGVIVGAEALLRWEHGVFGLQSPDKFIGLAEETGLILDLGDWARRETVRFAARINERRTHPLRFSVNVSTIELTHRDLVGSVTTALHESGADPSWLTLEITESLMTEDTPELLAMFRRLRKLGVGLSIDDFGTGYSNFQYLDRFPLTEIKIDKHFVGGLHGSVTKRIVVQAIIDFGRELGIDVVAEGISSDLERKTLQMINCPYGQGFLFHRPLDTQAFELCVGHR